MDKVIRLYTKGINKGTNKVPEEIAMLSIMETYSWTYDEYINTPKWVIEMIHEKNAIDARTQKLKK